MMTNGVF